MQVTSIIVVSFTHRKKSIAGSQCYKNRALFIRNIICITSGQRTIRHEVSLYGYCPVDYIIYSFFSKGFLFVNGVQDDYENGLYSSCLICCLKTRPGVWWCHFLDIFVHNLSIMNAIKLRLGM